MSGFSVCFDMGTVEFPCPEPQCRDGVTGDSYCSKCDAQGVLIEYVKTWFDNLAIAAALCASFDCGSVYASRCMSRIPFRREPWEPNVEGRPAPVWPTRA